MIGSVERRTLAGDARVQAGCGGRGLFTGTEAVVTLRPGKNGILFVVGGERVPAHVDHLSGDTVVAAFAQLPARHTVLARDGSRVITTEHVLAALAGMGVTDAEIVVEGGADVGWEIPIDDGSAAAFVRAIEAAGTEEIGELEPLVIEKVVTAEDGRGGMIVAEPADTTAYSYLLDYAGSGAGSGAGGVPLEKQTAEWSGDAVEFAHAVAPARTFSFAPEVEQMRALGLFAGFTPRDLLVLGEDGLPIENELRFDDEPARHKLLDLIGDLALVGRPIVGRVSAYRSGHALNHEMARRLAGQHAG